MITVNGWCADEMGGGSREMGRWVFSQWEKWAKTSVQTFSNIFLKPLTEGAVTAEAVSLF